MAFDNGNTMTANSKTTKQNFETQTADDSPYSSGNQEDIKQA